MGKQEFDEFVMALYGAYSNIMGKRGRQPIPYRQFKTRMRIWEW